MTTAASHTVVVPAAGTYRVDPGSSTIRFTTRHMFGLGKVTGAFSEVTGEIVVADPPSRSTVTASALSSSFDTGTPKRDDKVRSASFLDAATHPHITFTSSALEQTPAGWVLRGDLTATGVTAPLELTVTSAEPTATGVALEATGTVDRYAHGITAMKGMAGRRLSLALSVHATRV